MALFDESVGIGALNPSAGIANASTGGMVGSVLGNAVNKISGPGPSLQDPSAVAANVKTAQIAPLPQFQATKIAQIAGPQGPDMGQSNQARSYQEQLLNQLAARASGTGGPSLAEMQMKRAQEAALAQQQAQLASARGAVNPGLARQALQNQVALQSNLAEQDAQLRLQEQQAAEEQLAGLAGQTRTGDIQAAELAQAAQLEKYKGQLQTAIAQGQIDASQADKMFSVAVANAQQQAAMQQQVNILPYHAALASNEQDLAKSQLNNQKLSAGLGAVGQFGAAAAAMSDIKSKKDIKPANKKLDDFLDHITGYSYQYKDSKHGVGEHISPMAQDIEKSALGRSMVHPTTEGKMVDYGHHMGTMLAAMGQLNSRLKKIEGKK